jgi:branched-chain amino acid transport system substrate-binding protein
MGKKRISRRTFLQGVGTAGMAVSALGFPAIVKSASKLSEVEIACVYPLSGPAGGLGNNAVRGWNIAVEEINEGGGVKSLGGAKFKSLLGDTQSTPRVGMSEIEKVAKNKDIPVVVGCFQSAVTFPATQISEQYGIPHIVCVSTQPEILRRGFKYVVRLGMASDKQNEQTVGFIEEIGKRTGKVAQRAALLSTDDNYGKSCAEDYKNAIKKITKQEVVEDIYYPVKATNMDVEIAKIKAARPDVLYLSSYLTDAILIVEALHQQRMDTIANICGGSGYVDPKFLEIAGPLANYTYAAVQWNYDMYRPIETEFNDKIKKKYAVEANHHSALLYSAVYVIKDVLERVGTTDRDKFMEGLRKTNITSGRALVIPARFIRFDERGENVGFDTLIAQCLEGKYHTVWPLDFNPKYKPAWPAPKWENR